MNFEVIVQLKKEVLDPEARAIKETLGRVGFKGISGIQVSKRYVLDIDDSTANPQWIAESIAKEYLSNSVAETYQIRKL